MLGAICGVVGVAICVMRAGDIRHVSILAAGGDQFQYQCISF